MTSLVGVNCGEMNDYAQERMTINAFKTARGFGTTDKPWGEYSGPMQANGYPANPWGTCVFTASGGEPGTYKFSCAGKCDLKAVACNVEIKNQVFANGRTTADVIVLLGTEQVFLAFNGTNLSDFRLLRPGYTSDVDIFTKDYYAAIADVDSVRFMDSMGINSYPTGDWNLRGKVDDFSYNLRGLPHEIAIALANKTGKMIHVHIPHMADDNYIKNCAALYQSTLNKGLFCHVAYSNETWNSIFGQFHWLVALMPQAAKEDPSLAIGPKCPNVWYQAWEYTAKMLAKISKAFNYPNDARFRPVLECQIGNDAQGQCMIDYLNANYGGASKVAWGYAGAPYFGNYKEFMSRTDLTVDNFFGPYDFMSGNNRMKGSNYLLDRAMGAVSYCKNHVAQAKAAGLNAMIYECGPDYGQLDASIPAKAASQLDGRMAGVMTQYLGGLCAIMNGPVHVYSLASLYNKNGIWGTFDNMSRMRTSGKWLGMGAAAKSARATQTTTAPAQNGKFKIYGVTFNDANGNGKRENAEIIPNVTVILFDSMGNILGSKLSDKNGYYEFGNLSPGTYRVSTYLGTSVNVSDNTSLDLPIK